VGPAPHHAAGSAPFGGPGYGHSGSGGGGGAPGGGYGFAMHTGGGTPGGVGVGMGGASGGEDAFSVASVGTGGYFGGTGGSSVYGESQGYGAGTGGYSGTGTPSRFGGGGDGSSVASRHSEPSLLGGYDGFAAHGMGGDPYGAHSASSTPSGTTVGSRLRDGHAFAVSGLLSGGMDGGPGVGMDGVGGGTGGGVGSFSLGRMGSSTVTAVSDTAFGLAEGLAATLGSFGNLGNGRDGAAPHHSLAPGSSPASEDGGMYTRLGAGGGGSLLSVADHVSVGERSTASGGADDAGWLRWQPRPAGSTHSTPPGLQRHAGAAPGTLLAAAVGSHSPASQAEGVGGGADGVGAGVDKDRSPITSLLPSVSGGGTLSPLPLGAASSAPPAAADVRGVAPIGVRPAFATATTPTPLGASGTLLATEDSSEPVLASTDRYGRPHADPDAPQPRAGGPHRLQSGRSGSRSAYGSGSSVGGTLIGADPLDPQAMGETPPSGRSRLGTAGMRVSQRSGATPVSGRGTPRLASSGAAGSGMEDGSGGGRGLAGRDSGVSDGSSDVRARSVGTTAVASARDSSGRTSSGGTTALHSAGTGSSRASVATSSNGPGFAPTDAPAHPLPVPSDTGAAAPVEGVDGHASERSVDATATSAGLPRYHSSASSGAGGSASGSSGGGGGGGGTTAAAGRGTKSRLRRYDPATQGNAPAATVHDAPRPAQPPVPPRGHTSSVQGPGPAYSLALSPGSSMGSPSDNAPTGTSHPSPHMAPPRLTPSGSSGGGHRVSATGPRRHMQHAAGSYGSAYSSGGGGSGVGGVGQPYVAPSAAYTSGDPPLPPPLPHAPPPPGPAHFAVPPPPLPGPGSGSAMVMVPVMGAGDAATVTSMPVPAPMPVPMPMAPMPMPMPMPMPVAVQMPVPMAMPFGMSLQPGALVPVQLPSGQIMYVSFHGYGMPGGGMAPATIPVSAAATAAAAAAVASEASSAPPAPALVPATVGVVQQQQQAAVIAAPAPPASEAPAAGGSAASMVPAVAAIFESAMQQQQQAVGSPVGGSGGASSDKVA